MGWEDNSSSGVRVDLLKQFPDIFCVEGLGEVLVGENGKLMASLIPVGPLLTALDLY